MPHEAGRGKSSSFFSARARAIQCEPRPYAGTFCTGKEKTVAEKVFLPRSPEQVIDDQMELITRNEAELDQLIEQWRDKRSWRGQNIEAYWLLRRLAQMAEYVAGLREGFAYLEDGTVLR